MIERSLEVPLGQYYLQRLRTHLTDAYCGVTLRKFPEDLFVYESILWEKEVNVVVELGAGKGGSALWFRDRLMTFYGYRRWPVSGPLVISLDVDAVKAKSRLRAVDRTFDKTITLLEGDVLDPKWADRIRGMLPNDARPLIVEDTAHLYETTLAALKNFSPLVSVGGIFVVEDTHRDVPEMCLPEWKVDENGTPITLPAGPKQAVTDWLVSEGKNFKVRRDLERYLVTSHPGGWLERVR